MQQDEQRLLPQETKSKQQYIGLVDIINSGLKKSLEDTDPNVIYVVYVYQ